MGAVPDAELEPGSGPLKVRLLPDPERGPVTADGPLRSVQEAELTVPTGQLAELWHPETLERLARAYWRYLSRISLGLLRVVYAGSSRSIVLLSPKLELLRFRGPQLDTGPGFGRVTWSIERGVLVSRSGRGRGYLRFDVRRIDGPDQGGEARIRVRASVANFYPFLRGSGRLTRPGAWLYSQTQLRLHVLITRGFLRSLERGELPSLRLGDEAA
ncbi:MAG: hypothetical protein M3M99_02445 [Actinomycetota bacterium]|nr:hypothetical protein [Actinomycetota bacterium]